MDHKNAFVNYKITIADSLYAQAANIDYIEYVDDDAELEDETIVNEKTQVVTQVSNYYRKKPKNFKCNICKPNQ